MYFVHYGTYCFNGINANVVNGAVEGTIGVMLYCMSVLLCEGREGEVGMHGQLILVTEFIDSLLFALRYVF
jgi:hypothetical protein